ncbi:MAG: hypothetical protein Ta2B_29050 [Termitinemataceae bacterium]|nr:MAG: hypothetical protein Ta2B_29050 [Termitinemataceae bacterium]
MNAVHFGAGNIGRGFIGEVLFKNGFHIDFVDVNETVISELRSRGTYDIELASSRRAVDGEKERITVCNVSGINNKTEPESVVAAIANADIVTTAIGPNILPFIAELIAKGIKARRENFEDQEKGSPHAIEPKGTSKNSCAAILHCLFPHLFAKNTRHKPIMPAFFGFKLRKNPAQSCVPLVFRDAPKLMDVIACENMIGGTALLFSEVKKYLTACDLAFVEQYVGFPNAAVDRIVPAQQHSDPLFVSVEPFKEWVVDDSQRKAKNITLDGVEYAPDLLPFIERKLFSVNTGHASVAYCGSFYEKKTIAEAIVDNRILQLLKDVLNETGSLLVTKWGFDKSEHERYIKKIIGRFENPEISDDITRVARQPLRKLSYNERFIRPIRELKERGLSYKNILYAASLVFKYDCKDDPESVELQKMLQIDNRAPYSDNKHSLTETVKKVTGLQDSDLINELVEQIAALKQ